MQRNLNEPNERKIRNRALKKNDPLILGDDLAGRPICAADVLQEIQEYIHASYWIEANPLSHLRKYFPDFSWKYYQPNNIAELKQILNDKDYALLAMRYGDWGSGIVTAREPQKEQPRKICFWERSCIGDHTDLHWPVKALKTYGIRFLSPPEDARPSALRDRVEIFYEAELL